MLLIFIVIVLIITYCCNGNSLSLEHATHNFIIFTPTDYNKHSFNEINIKTKFKLGQRLKKCK